MGMHSYICSTFCFGVTRSPEADNPVEHDVRDRREAAQVLERSTSSGLGPEHIHRARVMPCSSRGSGVCSGFGIDGIGTISRRARENGGD